MWAELLIKNVFIFWWSTEAINIFPRDEACGWYFPGRSLMHSFYVWIFALASAAVCLLHFLVYFDRFEDVYQREKKKKVGGKSQGEFMRILSFEHHILLRWTQGTFSGFHLEITSIIHFFCSDSLCLLSTKGLYQYPQEIYISIFLYICMYIYTFFLLLSHYVICEWFVFFGLLKNYGIFRIWLRNMIQARLVYSLWKKNAQSCCGEEELFFSQLSHCEIF